MRFLLLLALASCGVEGPPGPQGTQGEHGPTGPTGTPAVIASAIKCAGPIPDTALAFTYRAAVMRSGDVWATGSVSDGTKEIGASFYHAAKEDGAALGIVSFQFDVAGAANGGNWRLEVARSTGVVVMTNFDADQPGGQKSWIIPARCETTTF
jgi:hypothetical protein